MELIIDGCKSQFYQWDTGQRLIVLKADTCSEVHFSNRNTKEALVVRIETENDVRFVNVPNILLQTNEMITAYLTCMEDGETETRYAKSFVVRSREKPENYVYTQTEVLNYAYLDERLKKLEGEGLAQAVADYLEDNPVQAGATAEEAAQIQQNKADIEKIAKDKLDASALTEAVNEALAQAKASGEFKGEPGEPGKTPEKGKDYFTDADKREIAELAADMVEIPEGDTVELDTTLTASGKAADAKAVGDALNGKLSTKGGTMTGKIVFPTGDQNAGFANSQDMKIFGYGNGYFRVGDTQYPAQIRGKGTNPMYNDKKILVEGDIVGGLLTVETITVDDSGEPVNIPVTGLTLDLTSYNAKVGDGFYINPVVAPSNATNKAVTWKSNATNIATVDGNGYVECIAEGSAVITCTTVDGGFTATCSVSVAAESSGGGDEPEVTLSSISATYSGGDVAVGTAVTDLTGIVVTAHYSDGSTATVTDYTLSGTIAEGSNTIAVSYGGKTTTFAVTGVAESGGTTGGKIQFSTLERTVNAIKNDGSEWDNDNTYRVAIPYTDGMQIHTLWTATWSTNIYPPMLVVTDGNYTPVVAEYEKNDDKNATFGIGGKLPNMAYATLTGYAEGSSVIVNMLIGYANNEDMDNSDWLYYIPGGEA